MAESDKNNASDVSSKSQEDESSRREWPIGNAKPIPLFVVAIAAVGWLVCVLMLAVMAWGRAAGS